jgi:hypothetical protein
MNQKINIFEELNKMKRLIHTKPGVVISEQASNPATDIATIKAEMGMGFANSDEQKVVDVLKKYTADKATFQNFLNQYKTVTGTALTDELPKQFQPKNDQKEIEDLNTSLSKLGITFEVKLSNDRSKFIASFKGLDTPTTPNAGTVNTDENWKTTYKCVLAQPGVVAVKLKNGTTAYKINNVTYYNNGRKKLADKTVANYSCATEFKTKGGVPVDNTKKYKETVANYSKNLQTTLGLPVTGQLSDNDLNNILASL